MFLSMAFQKPYKTMFFWSLLLRNLIKTIIFLVFWFLRNSCPSRLLPKSFPETRKTRKNIIFIMFLKSSDQKNRKTIVVKCFWAWRFRNPIKQWFFWSLLFRNLTKHFLVFEKLLSFPPASQESSRNQKKNTLFFHRFLKSSDQKNHCFYVCFWAWPLQNHTKNNIFLVFLVVTFQKPYKNHIFITFLVFEKLLSFLPASQESPRNQKNHCFLCVSEK